MDLLIKLAFIRRVAMYHKFKGPDDVYLPIKHSYKDGKNLNEFTNVTEAAWLSLKYL